MSSELQTKVLIDIDETEDDVTTLQCELHGVIVSNTASAEMFLKLFNGAAADVAVGTTEAKILIGVEAGRTVHIEFSRPIIFSAGLCAAAVTTAPTAGNTGAGANEVNATIIYKDT